MLRKFVLSLLSLSVLQRTVNAVPALTPGDPKRFTFYNIPQPLSGPCDLCKGTDGALWGQDQFTNTVFRIDPSTGKIETITIPFTLPPVTNATLPNAAGKTALGCAIRPGADGNIYSAFGTRNQLVRINPTTRKVTIFTPPNPTQPIGNLEPFNDIFTAATGIWYTQTTANLVSFFDFKTEKFTNYQVPTPNSGPLGIFVDSAGTIWFVEFFANKIAKIDPKTKKITEYPFSVDQQVTLLNPAVVRAETQNRYIWFTALTGNSMGRFDKQTNQIKAFPNPLAGGAVVEDTVDSKGNVWYSDLTHNVLSRIDPQGQTDQIVMPGTTTVTPVSVPAFVNIAVNYGPGNAIWFTNELANRVGRYQL